MVFKVSVYTTATWQYFINLELHMLSTWHSNQQVDGGHYEAKADAFPFFKVVTTL